MTLPDSQSLLEAILEQVRQEVAALLKISLNQIERLECMGLEHIAPELKRQSQEFADLPDVVGSLSQLWQQRWQQLSQATV